MTAKADRAKELLNDPLLEEAFDNLRQNLLDGFEACGIDDNDSMRDIKITLALLKGLKQQLVNIISDGTYEDFRANQDSEESLNGRH